MNADEKLAEMRKLYLSHKALASQREAMYEELVALAWDQGHEAHDPVDECDCWNPYRP